MPSFARGATVIAAIDSDGSRSVFGVHVAPPSSETQMPPLTEPAKTIDAFWGWIARAWTAPATGRKFGSRSG